MVETTKKRSWALIQSQEYVDEYGRLPSKYRNQVARKIHELMRDPKPGGSKTPLKGYVGLYRLRAGDFRIIYAFDAAVVQLLTLRRREESTYDDLDSLEIAQLQGFRAIKGAATEQKIGEWEDLAKKWAAPKPRVAELLPRPITAAILEQLNVDKALRPVLLAVTTVDGLLDCDEVPLECRQSVLELICPRAEPAQAAEPTVVVAMADLVDVVAAEVCGPIDALGNGENVSRDATISDAVEHSARGKSRLPVRYKPPTPLLVVSTRRHEPMKPYRGNTSRGIGKDARYTVKLDGKIQLIYSVGENERALLTTDEHAELAAMVNEAKRRGGASQKGGGFIINEYRHLLVPTQSDGVLFAGVYTRDLEFEFEKTLISPVAPPTINRGDVWPGPHVGIKYTLAAGASDVRYEEETPRGTLRRVCLQDHHASGDLSDVLEMCRSVKPNGGAIYVNEARELFAPVDDGKGYKRRYIGHLGAKPWFPERQ
jgi:mRNA-degrading endonuclease RelE of RelBE toxin-antitoxin system